MPSISNYRKHLLLYSRPVNKLMQPKASISIQQWKYQEKILQKESVVANISNILKCSELKALEIYEEIPVIRAPDSLHVFKENVELFMKNDVSLESISQNTFLLTKDTGKKRFITEKIKTLTIKNFYKIIH